MKPNYIVAIAILERKEEKTVMIKENVVRILSFQMMKEVKNAPYMILLSYGVLFRAEKLTA